MALRQVNALPRRNGRMLERRGWFSVPDAWPPADPEALLPSTLDPGVWRIVA